MYNSDTNPNILWEQIKDSIRDETIRFATNKKRKDGEKIKNLEINLLQEQIQNTNNQNN